MVSEIFGPALANLANACVIVASFYGFWRLIVGRKKKRIKRRMD